LVVVCLDGRFMYDEEFWERFGKWARRLALAIALVAATGGYLYYRRFRPPPAKTPQENLAILRDHGAARSARHLAAARLKSDPSTIPDLIDELEHGDDEGRFLAAMTLGSMGVRARGSVTDGDLAPLAQLPHLRTLRLHGTAISDAALEFLSHLEQLEDLNVEGTAVTGAGLQHLKKLTGLKYLHQDAKTLTWPDIEDLRKSMPKLRID
jgi:hypothetical protein